MNQEEKLKCLFLDILENVKAFIDPGGVNQIKKGEISGLDYLRQCPIITKDIIKKNYFQYIHNSLIKQNIEKYLLEENYKFNINITIPNTKLLVECTSGSSGIPFMVIKTLNESLKLGNYMWKLRNKIALVKATELFDFSHNVIPETQSAFPFKPEDNIKQQLQNELLYLESEKYKWWHMNTYDIEYYYQQIQEQGIVFSNPYLTIIENNGAFLSDTSKKNYEDFFSCKVIDHYGCRETWMIALDCKKGYKHVNEDAVYFELIDERGQVITKPNQVGRVVITSLLLHHMPFIRYALNDYAYYENGICTCGCKSKRIVLLPGKERIIGTKLYGNRCFKDIICYINSAYNIKNFYQITVRQLSKNHFEVMVYNNKEDCQKLETAFIQSAEVFIPHNKYVFHFNYINSRTENEEIFSLAKYKDEVDK